jgi:type II secretory pathway pseudopilin PulG
MKLLNTHRTGQSMVEAVFAIGILLIVTSAVLGLTTSNISGSQSAEFQIIANNLAREGIEVVRSMRDANWLSGQQWNQGLSDSGGVSNRARVEFNEAQNTWSLNFNYVDDSLYISPNGVYSHQETGSTKSSYARFIDLNNICADGSGNERIAFPCAAGEQQVGVKVTARVTWTERGRQHAVTLEDLLYAWK